MTLVKSSTWGTATEFDDPGDFAAVHVDGQQCATTAHNSLKHAIACAVQTEDEINVCVDELLC
jgi:hypothetical protein